MIFDQHINFGYSVLQTGSGVIGSTSATSLVIAGSGDLPDPAVGPYNVVVWPAGVQPLRSNAEIMRVTAKTGATLTVTRAQEGTTALSVIAAGYQVALNVTSKLFTDIEAALPTGPSGATVLYDSGVLTSTAATLDTGANGIAAGHAAIEILFYGVSNSGAGGETWTARVNGNSGSNYESQSIMGIDSSASASSIGLASSWSLQGLGGGSNTYCAYWAWTCVGYAGTAFWKSFIGQAGVFIGATSGGNRVGINGFGWRQTSAINQFTLFPPSTKAFAAGSRLVVLGLG